MAELPKELPDNVRRLIETRVPEPNKATQENPLVKFLQELLDAYHKATETPTP